MKLIYNFLQSAIKRHFEETKLLIDQLASINNNILLSEPVKSGRPLGEIVLHMIRSYEYYLQGLTNGIWKPLPYTLTKYNSVQKIKDLYDIVIDKAKRYLEEISQATLTNVLEDFNRPATNLEVLLEMLEHGIQHRGQLLVYFRLLGLEPVKIPYIV